MGINERADIEQLLAVVRGLAADLQSLGEAAVGGQVFAVRLAQAHAWGLVDQLDDLVEGRSSASSIAPLAPAT